MGNEKGGRNSKLGFGGKGVNDSIPYTLSF